MNGARKPCLAAAVFSSDDNGGSHLARQAGLVGDAPHRRQFTLQPVQPKRPGRPLADGDELLRVPGFLGLVLGVLPHDLLMQRSQRFRKRNEACNGCDRSAADLARNAQQAALPVQGEELDVPPRGRPVRWNVHASPRPRKL